MNIRLIYIQSIIIALLVLLSIFSSKVYGQNTSYLVEIDTLAKFEQPYEVSFTYGRFDGNENADIVMLSLPFQYGSTDPGFFKYERVGETWSSSKLNIGGLNSYTHYIFDFNRDGFDDIIILNINGQNGIYLFLHTGISGSLEFEPPIALQKGFERFFNLLIRDINNDGYEDLIKNDYTWIGINNRGNGLLNFYPLLEDRSSQNPKGIYDINRDGWQDIHFSNSGSNGVFFLTQNGVFDFTDPKIVREYPRNIIPIEYDQNHGQEVVTLEADSDFRSNLIHFELKFYRVSNNFDFINDFTFNLDSLSVDFNELNESIYQTPFPDSNGADIIFSYSISSNERLNHFLKINNGIVEISSTDTVSYKETIPYEIIDNKYVTPVSNSLERFGMDKVIPMIKSVSGIDLENSPGVPGNITTEIIHDLLKISWNPVQEDSARNLSYSVYMENLETGFKYRSDYQITSSYNYDNLQNRVKTNFKLFKNLPSGTYNISIQSVDEFSRRSEKSGPVSVVIKNDDRTQIPDSVKVRAVDAGIEVSFKMTSYFDSILVYRSLSESFEEYTYLGKANPYLQTYTDEEVDKSTSYTYALKSFLNGEASGFTEKVTTTSSSVSIFNLFTLENPSDFIEEVVSYDLNLDGYKDLVVNARLVSGNNSVYLIPGSSDGFDKANIKKLFENEFVNRLIVADWNGDLQPDLIYQTLNTENWSYPTNIELLDDLEIVESITFNADQSFNITNPSELLFESDLDLNGRFDLVYGGFDHLIVAWNDESGPSFEAITKKGFGTHGTKLLDLDQDGFEDLIVDEGPGKSPIVYINKMLERGSRGFQRKNVGLPIYPGTSTVGVYYYYLPILFNDDIYPDLIVATEIQIGADTIDVGFIEPRTLPANKIFEYNPETESFEHSGFRLDTLKTGLHYPIHFNNDDFIDFIQTDGNEVKLLINDENSSLSELSFNVSSVSSYRELLQVDADNDGDEDILFVGYASPTIFQIENVDVPRVISPSTPEITDISGDENEIVIEWSASNWSNTLDSQAGYGIRISSDEKNIVVGNINPVTGKRNSLSKLTAFQNTKLKIPELPSGSYEVSVSAYDPLNKASGFSNVKTFTVVGTDIEWEGNTKLTFKLDQNYPNPFNPITVISYQIPEASKVTLKVYDITGRIVQTIVDQKQNAGTYQVNFDASELASGIYIYRLKSGNNVYSKKLTLIK